MTSKNDLSKRLFKFSVDVIQLLRTLPKGIEYKVIYYQLVKSSTSTGANYEEAQAGVSRADFNNKVRIALKEIKESNYWLRIIKEIQGEMCKNQHLLESLIVESEELNKILGSIVNKTRKQ